MDSEYNNIKQKIDQQAYSFKIYLKEFLLDQKTWELLNLIALQTDIYIFSGVIRNFLLGYLENRDLDIVVRNIDKVILPKNYWNHIQLEKNSFGGYKVKIGQLTVDAWDIKNTWGVQKLQLRDTPYSLINTAFFNFSAIIYDYNREKFIYDKHFLQFYKNHAMDIVFDENPNIPLCILNTIYYSFKYDFPIKYCLCKWIVQHYRKNFDFQKVQIRHFKHVFISNNQIVKFINICSEVLPRMGEDKKNSVLIIKNHPV